MADFIVCVGFGVQITLADGVEPDVLEEWLDSSKSGLALIEWGNIAYGGKAEGGYVICDEDSMRRFDERKPFGLQQLPPRPPTVGDFIKRLQRVQVKASRMLFVPSPTLAWWFASRSW